MNLSVRDKIEQIEKYEKLTVERLESDLDSGKYTGFQADSIRLVQLYFRYSRHGKLQFFGDDHDERNGRWANVADGVPVLRQLVTDPHLVVDLKAVKDEDDCRNEYGLTSRQLFDLAQRGYVRFNLYEYDSTKDEPEGRFQPYVDSKCEYMEHILDPSVDFCRITSIRKEAFFNRLAGGPNYTFQGIAAKESQFMNLVEEGRARFGAAIAEASEEELIEKMNLRDSNKRAAREIVARQYAYVRAVIDGVKQRRDPAKKVYLADKWLNGHVLHDGVTPDRRAEQVRIIKGLKNLIATDYSASMGGSYNMAAHTITPFLSLASLDSSRDLNIQAEGETWEDAAEVSPDEIRRRWLASPTYQALYETVEEIARTKANDSDVPSPTVVNDQQYKTYLQQIVSELRDQKVQNRISDLVAELANVNREPNERIATLEDLLCARGEAYSIARKLKWEQEFAAKTVTTAITGSMMVLTGFPAPAVASLALMLISYKKPEWFGAPVEEFLLDSKRNLVTSINSLEDILGT